MRLTALFPLLCTLTAFILALLCIFAGSKKGGYIERADILTLNTSMLGRITLNTSQTSSSFLNSLAEDITDSVTDSVNDVIDSVADQLNIHDFYSAHLLNYCEGYYTPSPLSNSTSDPSKNITKCSNRTSMFHFDPSAIIQSELEPGISLADLQWPDTIKDAVHAVEIASRAMFVMYCIGVATTGLALVGAFFAVIKGGRLAFLLNNLLALLAFLTLGIASAIVTAIVSKVVSEVNDKGADIGISATKGNTFLGMTWAATALMLVTAGGWVYEFVAWRRRNRGMEYVFEGKKGRY